MSRLLGALMLSALAYFAAPLPAMAQDSSYIKIPNQDAEMEEAKAKARASLDHFWSKLDSPAQGDARFSIKVAIPYGHNNSEHIWTNDIERKDGKITAVINNAPRDAKHIRYGQRIDVAPAQISDWMYVRADGKIVGNYTMRPLLKRMPAHDAERYREMLADP